MSKQRVALKLDDDEIVVVGSLDRWQHLILVYEALAEDYPEDSAAWFEAADWIREWIKKSDTTQEW